MEGLWVQMADMPPKNGPGPSPNDFFLKKHTIRCAI